MTGREIIKKRLNHEPTDITPYAVEFEPELYRRLTEYYGDEDWQQKKLRTFHAIHLTVDTVQMTELDEVYARDGYGALWRMDRKPFHLEKPPLPEAQWGDYVFPSKEQFVAPILAQKEEAIARYNADNEHYRIISMGWGIFENTWRLRGFENALTDTMIEEDFYAEMTAKVTENYLAMLKACEDVPADAYLFGDDWGDQRGVIIGRDRWVKLIKPCLAKIYDAVHKQGKKIIQHSCGSIVDIYDDLIEIGMDCHESVQPEASGMAPERIKSMWGDRLSFWGSLGSQGILAFGSPADIRTEINRLAELFSDNGGYVLAPAKPLADEMDIQRAVAVVETLSELR